MILSMLDMLLPIVVLLGVGILSRRMHILSHETIAGMKKLVTSFFLPALVFNTMANSHYGFDSIILLLCSTAYHVIVFGIAYKIRHIFKENGDMYPYMMMCFECGMIGYALISALVGSENLSPVATLDLPACIMGFSVVTNGLSMISGNKDEHGTVYHLLRTPTFLAVVIGTILGLAGVGSLINASAIGTMYQNTIQYLTAPLTPIILICIGYDFSIVPQEVKDALLMFSTRIISAAIFWILTVFLCKTFTGMDKTLFITLTMYFALPPTFLTPIYVTDPKRSRFVSSFLSISIVFSLLVFAIICMFI